MTFDTASPLGKPTDPRARSPNGRTPSFDLDSVYGAGPVGSPQLYDPADRAKLKVESGGLFEDLPRMADGTAIIGDPRNDENVMIAGLQAAFLLFHNNVVDRLRAGGTTRRGRRAYSAGPPADHLALPVDDPPRVPAALRRAADGERDRCAAAGASTGRQGRGVHPGRVPGRRLPVRPLDGAAVVPGQPHRRRRQAVLRLDLRPRRRAAPDPNDLRGGFRAPRRFVGWQTFFDFGDGQVKPNKRIDTRISTPLFDLPIGAIATHAGRRPCCRSAPCSGT